MITWGRILKKNLIIYLLIPFTLMAYNDADFDGVSDEHDLCPNSTMLDIVDKTGCRVEKLVVTKENRDHFNLMLGVNYSQDDKTVNESFQLNYTYKKLALALQTNNYENGGQGDTTLSLYYKIKPNAKLSYNLGASLILPTYDSQLNNNNLDYRVSANLNYFQNDISYFAGVSYTITNDDDINQTNYKLSYQNSQSYYFGFGSYFIEKLYSSLSYSSSSSLYKNEEDTNTLSLYNYYNINQNWFTTFSYSYGLSDNASEQLYLNLGYHF